MATCAACRPRRGRGRARPPSTVTGDLHRLLLDSTAQGPAHHDERGRRRLDAADRDDACLSRFVSRETSLYGAETGMISEDPGQVLEGPWDRLCRGCP